MNIQWIETFIVCARTLHFRKAAEQLLVSQPSVSVHIRSLEQYLGVKLFKRNRQQVALTNVGKQFVIEAEQILEQMEHSVAHIRSFSQGYRHQWTIAITPLMAETILPGVLRSFMNSHPQVEVTIKIDSSEKIDELVYGGEANIGISALQSTRKDVRCIEIYEEDIVFIVPNDIFDYESGPPIDVHDLLHYTTIFTDRHPVYWEPLLRKLQLHVPSVRTMHVGDAHIAKRFVQEGLGVSFLPHSIVRRELLEGRLMDPYVKFMDLPRVKTYVHVKEKGELESAFIRGILNRYFG